METMEYNDLADNTKIDNFNKYGGGEEDRSVYDESSNEDNLSDKPGDSDDDSEEKQDESDVEAESNNDEDDEGEEKTEKKPTKANVAPVIVDSDEDDDEDDDNEDYLKKFDKELRKNYIAESHPEVLTYNYSEIQALSKVIRDPKTGVIIDEFHKTIPILTKYEKTRILGQRAKQINSGAKPYVQVNPKFEMDGYTIAIKELEQKRLPFIIRRPLPNGASEFWKLEDLQIINM